MNRERNRRTALTDRGPSTAALVFNGPALIVLLATVLYPIAFAVYLSFHQYILTIPARPFVGFKNYGELFASGVFWSSLGTTLVFAVLAVVCVMVAGFLVALLLNERYPGRGVLRAILLVPWAVPPVVNGLIWQWLLNPKYGVINSIASSLGLIHSYQAWLTTMPSALLWTVAAYAWTNIPLAALLMLAGLQTIPQELYEAATVDGAGALRKLSTITLPMLRPTLVVVLIFQTIFALKVFDIIYVLTGGGPGNSTTVMGWLIYSKTFQQLNFGSGSALAMILGILTLGIAVGYFRLFGRDIESS